MKFSGHETFHIREGWLHKGLSLLHDSPDKFYDSFMHDWLGVGSNMGKSIQHWLVATGLVERKQGDNRGMVVSELGHAILQYDPYFLSLFTWWVLHINLVNGIDQSSSWNWFFNHFSQMQFKKEQCVEQLRRYLSTRGSNLPGNKTLERDIGCLLSSYARIVPEEDTDPEENYNCPFRELGMLTYFKDTAAYHLTRNIRQVPGHALAYCLSVSMSNSDAQICEISVSDAAIRINGPGRCFGVSPNGLFDLVESIMQSEPQCGVELVALAGKRMIQFPNFKPIEWISRYFTGLPRSEHGPK